MDAPGTTPKATSHQHQQQQQQAKRRRLPPEERKGHFYFFISSWKERAYLGVSEFFRGSFLLFRLPWSWSTSTTSWTTIPQLLNSKLWYFRDFKFLCVPYFRIIFPPLSGLMFWTCRHVGAIYACHLSEGRCNRFGTVVCSIMLLQAVIVPIVCVFVAPAWAGLQYRPHNCNRLYPAQLQHY